MLALAFLLLGVGSLLAFRLMLAPVGVPDAGVLAPLAAPAVRLL